MANPKHTESLSGPPLGVWRPDGGRAPGEVHPLDAGVARLNDPIVAIDDHGATQAAIGGVVVWDNSPDDGLPILAVAPPVRPHKLGDPSFCHDHGIRYPYYSGAMANGVGSEEIVEAMGRGGLLGFFGSAGLSPARIEQACQRLTESMAGLPFGFNLINSPHESAWEEQVVELYLKYDVRLIEASAFIALSLPLVRFRVHGIHRNDAGEIVAPNRIIAKLSRVEVATRFFSPPPKKYLKKLIESGEITEEQAELAEQVPMAQDVTAEADSGGHTDHRPALALLPSMLRLRDEMQAKHAYAMKLRVGLAGGISTPASAAAAFSLGADYIVTGSINQACRESGTSDKVRTMLAEATPTDVGQAPAADMFEKGVTVQVLKKGNRFVLRGSKLYELYRGYPSLEDIPEEDRAKVEEEIFQAPLDDIWEQTKAFFQERDPKQIEKAEANPRHKMALVFRWYLGQSSTWANQGVETRANDYQIWCGPAMGAFNEWVKGSYLEAAENRDVVTVAFNILYGAALYLRLEELRRQGVSVPADWFHITPSDSETIRARLDALAPAAQPA